PPGLCFRFLDAKVRHTESGYRIGGRIEGADNVYDLAKDLDEGALKVVRAAAGETAEVPTIRPHYDFYFNLDEAARQVPASLQFENPPPARITLAFEHAGGISKYRTLDFTRGNLGGLASLLARTGQPGSLRVGAGVLVLLLALATSSLDARASASLGFGQSGFAAAIGIRWASLSAAATIESIVISLAAVFVVLLPWLAMASRFHKRKPSVRPRGRVTARVSKLIAPLWQSFRSAERISAIELVVLILSIGISAYMLWSGSSFRWSIFEERDFLEARQILTAGTFPIYGPELLAGGHT